jgi:hypothetical protein
LPFSEGKVPISGSTRSNGNDLVKQIGKIKLAKTRVQSMSGTEFVNFLQEKPPKRLPPSNLKVRDFIGDEMHTS